MKPIIGVTTSVSDERKLTLNLVYTRAVTAAGGVPVALPNDRCCADEIFSALDGVLFSGGGDIHGKYFGQPLHEKAASVSEERDEFELELFKLTQKARKPVLGICRGVQLINIAMGGDIFQHMENHSQTQERHETSHFADIYPNTFLHGFFKSEKIAVNSFHHQALDRLGEGLAVSAVSEDGYIEGVEYREPREWFCVGVQWHPEEMLADPRGILQLELFKAFVEAAAVFKSK